MVSLLTPTPATTYRVYKWGDDETKNVQTPTTFVGRSMKIFVGSLLLICNVCGHSLVKRQEGDIGRVPESREVAPNVYSFTADGFSISMFMITSEGVMVIDPMNVYQSETMLAEIRKITDAPIKYLFYSHNHWDHTKGGKVFKDEGATIISHIDAQEFIKANPSEDLLVPDKNWVGERYDVSLGGMNLELHYLGLNHGNGMTVFVLTNEKVKYVFTIRSQKEKLKCNHYNRISWLPELNIIVIIQSNPIWNRNSQKQLYFVAS